MVPSFYEDKISFVMIVNAGGEVGRPIARRGSGWEDVKCLPKNIPKADYFGGDGRG